MEFSSISVPLHGAFDSRIKFPRVIKTEPRSVDCFEVELYTADQPGTTFIDQKPIPLKKGTLVCAKPGQTRSSILHFKCLYFHLDTQDAQIRKILNNLPDACVLSDFSTLEGLFRKLIRLDAESFPEERLLQHSCLLELVYAVSQYGYNRNSDYAHRQALLQIERYIRENLTGDLSLDKLSTIVNLSPSYFHKLFCSHFSVTPGEYVLHCRISAAKSMLGEGGVSLGQIAERCGFASQSYFNYRFKQSVGMTPLQYRRDCLSRLEV